MKSRFATIVLVLALLAPSFVFGRDTREQQRIDFLINSVENSKGIVFIRNGSEYGGAAAAKHLRTKVNYGGDRIKTAEEFVKYCASESSMTHRKYAIRTSDGKTSDAATYFAEQLREFDQRGR